MMKNFKFALVAAAVAVSFSGIANAAQDGSLNNVDPTVTGSQGESDIILVKDNAIQISDVGDLDLGQFSSLAPAATANDSDDVCVFSTTGGYSITIDSKNRPGEFTLSNGGTGPADSMAYSVTWQAAGAPAALPITPAGSTLGNAAAPLPASSTSPSCADSGGTNATFAVSVDAVAFNAATAGTYEDTVTLLVKAL